MNEKTEDRGTKCAKLELRWEFRGGDDWIINCSLVSKGKVCKRSRGFVASLFERDDAFLSIMTVALLDLFKSANVKVADKFFVRNVQDGRHKCSVEVASIESKTYLFGVEDCILKMPEKFKMEWVGVGSIPYKTALNQKVMKPEIFENLEAVKNTIALIESIKVGINSADDKK